MRLITIHRSLTNYADIDFTDPYKRHAWVGVGVGVGVRGWEWGSCSCFCLFVDISIDYLSIFNIGKHASIHPSSSRSLLSAFFNWYWIACFTTNVTVKTLFSGIGIFHHKYKTVMGPSYLYNGNSYTSKRHLYIETTLCIRHFTNELFDMKSTRCTHIHWGYQYTQSTHAHELNS